MTAPFAFDAGFQRVLLRLMQTDDAFALACVRWLVPEHFTVDALGWIFRVIASHVSEYQQRCSDVVLRHAVRALTPQLSARYAAEVEHVIGLGIVAEDAWVKAQLAEFVRQAIFAEAHQTSAALFNGGRRSEAYDVMARAQERIVEVGFGKEARTWLFDELQDRQLARVRKQSDAGQGAFMTGLRQLDDLTDGGVQHGQVWSVFAYAKRCKSTWLTNQGFHATRVHRRPTLHIILEGREDEQSSRYDSCFSTEQYAAVRRGDIEWQLYQQLAAEYASLRRLMVIRALTDWDTTILDVQKELHYLKSHQFVPELLILDYADLGRSRDRVDSETQHQLAFSRDLKRLVNNTGLACWTAWQAQRPPKGAHTKEHVLTSSDVADSYAKVRIVDSYGSLNATDEEMEQGLMRVFWEGHRSASVGKVWSITNDLGRMRMATSAVPYEPKE